MLAQRHFPLIAISSYSYSSILSAGRAETPPLGARVPGKNRALFCERGRQWLAGRVKLGLRQPMSASVVNASNSPRMSAKQRSETALEHAQGTDINI